MQLKSPQSAVIAAVISNALAILFLLPLAFEGVRYPAVGTSILLRDNLLICVC
jgi:K+-transporting ATPase ATPase B chain